jgi:hypothetical protein
MHPVLFFHPVDKVNYINNYFTSVSNIDSEPDLPVVPPLAPCELSGIVINEQEVCDQFQSLNISKPVKPLTILFKKSLHFGVVPGDGKLANVSALYKGKGGRPDSSQGASGGTSGRSGSESMLDTDVK